MRNARIAVTIDRPLLTRPHRMVKKRTVLQSESRIQEALRDKLGRTKHGQVDAECIKLDPHVEQNLAEEGLAPMVDHCKAVL